MSVGVTSFCAWTEISYEKEFLTLENQYLFLIEKEKESHKEFENRLWIKLLYKGTVGSDSLIV